MNKTPLHDRLSFYYNWAALSDNPAAVRAAVREFLDNGVRRFVITSGLLLEMVRNPEKASSCISW